MTNTQEIRDLENKYVLQTYSRAPFVLDHGEGIYLYDTDGKAYLDFVSGIAVNALGYGDLEVREAIVDQVDKLIHVSNLYYTQPQAELAELLVKTSFADRIFFCNSGAESVEGAIKFARKWAKTHYGKGKNCFVSLSGAFHGRTMGALALTPRPHYQDAFRPLMPGARLAEFNNLDSVAAQMDESVCAIIAEPVQGEGGVNPADPEFLQGLRELCDRYHALLIFDEVQCGLGRTGSLWAHQQYDIEPDMMTTAKPVGAGLPMGLVFLKQHVADAIEPGDHASTFAGGPVVCAASKVVVSRVANPSFLAHVQEMGDYLVAGLKDIASRQPVVEEVRGLGLIIGIQCSSSVGPVVKACYEAGLLTCSAGPNVLRLLPPLIIEKGDADKALAMIEEALRVIGE